MVLLPYSLVDSFFHPRYNHSAWPILGGLAIAALLGYGLGKVMNLRSLAVAFLVVATAGLVMFYVGNATVVVGSERPCFI